jgi:hypothetical protein
MESLELLVAEAEVPTTLRQLVRILPLAVMGGLG